MSGDDWTWPDGSVEAPRSVALEEGPAPQDQDRRYEMGGELGRGGMGKVHAAQDRRLDREGGAQGAADGGGPPPDAA